ncbi:hypothetical protein MBLNU13_g08970t1 [Cladosporium sp. NU13]
MISHTEYDDIDAGERYQPALDLSGDGVSSSDGVDDNFSNSYWGLISEDGAGPLDGDQPRETQAAYKDGSLDPYRRHLEDGPSNPTQADKANTCGSHYRQGLKEGELRLVKILPGSTNGLIRCSSEFVPVPSNKGYNQSLALSQNVEVLHVS